MLDNITQNDLKVLKAAESSCGSHRNVPKYWKYLLKSLKCNKSILIVPNPDESLIIN